MSTSAKQAVLPDLEHLCLKDYEEVYEPSEDTYLLCDALEGDRIYFKAHPPKVCVEIGSGSGCAITFLAKMLCVEENLGPATFIATDINAKAVEVTKRTAEANGVAQIETKQTTFLQGLEDRLYGHIDVLLFNFPYVPTPQEEVGGSGIEASWAGGKDGRVVIDQFLPLLPSMLAQNGRAYLVFVEENKPQEIIGILWDTYQLKGEIVLRKRARNEGLQIMLVTQPE